MRAIVSGFTYSLLLIFVPSLHTVAQDKDWLPVTAEEIKMKTPKVESGADAEVLFWEVRITDNYQKSVGYSTTLDHHVKIGRAHV